METYTYLNNAALEEPDIDADGVIYYFNCSLSDLCPFLLNTRSNKFRRSLGWRRIARNVAASYCQFFLRNQLNIYYISSESFQKTEQELLAYDIPITKIIEMNSVKDIQEEEDRHILDYLVAP